MGRCRSGLTRSGIYVFYAAALLTTRLGWEDVVVRAEMRKGMVSDDPVSALTLVFHRLESPTQTRTTALAQVRSGEVWGKAIRGGGIPCVKAYRGSIPASDRGVEFTTPIVPQKGSGTPHEARWYYPHTPGVKAITSHGEDFAVIPASVKNMQP